MVDKYTAIMLCLSAFSFGVTSGSMVMMWDVTNRYQHEAIERGYAQHDPVTGAWEWIEDGE